MWKKIPGFANYEASTAGKIRNSGTKKVLKEKERWDGYSEVTLMKNDKRHYKKVHRVIASTFEVPGSGNIVNHKNSKRSDNRVANLEKTTTKGNNQSENKKKTSKDYQNRSNQRKYSSKKK